MMNEDTHIKDLSLEKGVEHTAKPVFMRRSFVTMLTIFAYGFLIIRILTLVFPEILFLILGIVVSVFLGLRVFALWNGEQNVVALEAKISEDGVQTDVAQSVVSPARKGMRIAGVTLLCLSGVFAFLFLTIAPIMGTVFLAILFAIIGAIVLSLYSAASSALSTYVISFVLFGVAGICAYIADVKASSWGFGALGVMLVGGFFGVIGVIVLLAHLIHDLKHRYTAHANFIQFGELTIIVGVLLLSFTLVL